MLSGCASSITKGAVEAGITLPRLPAELARSCPKPPLKGGDDARAALARALVAHSQCAKIHEQTLHFYDDVREHFAKPQKGKKSER